MSEENEKKRKRKISYMIIKEGIELTTKKEAEEYIAEHGLEEGEVVFKGHPVEYETVEAVQLK